MINKETFGAFIREKRTEHGLTQRDLAEKLYISESAVSKWEMGKSYPDITLIPGICEVLDVSESELIAGATDTEYRTMRREAQLYRRISQTFFWGFTIAYAIALVACVAADLVGNHAFTFSPVVLGSLLVAFSFIPTWTRFTERHKLVVFAGSTFLSLLVLFLICCVQQHQAWFGNAASGVLLGYAIVFGPFLLKRYLPEHYRRFSVLAYFVIVYACLLMLLYVVRVTFAYNLGDGITIATYCYLPLFAIGIVHLLKVNRPIKAGIDVLVAGLVLYGLPGLLAMVLGGSEVTATYAIDFSDWVMHTTGNSAIIVFVASIVVAAILIAAGLLRSRRK